MDIDDGNSNRDLGYAQSRMKGVESGGMSIAGYQKEMRHYWSWSTVRLLFDILFILWVFAVGTGWLPLATSLWVLYGLVFVAAMYWIYRKFASIRQQDAQRNSDIKKARDNA